MRQIRIGMSGWRYEPWRGTFYPKDLTQKRELEYASRKLNSIELNGSFYSLQRPASWKLWYGQTPDDFVFSVKGGQFITHLKRLKEIEIPLANFFAQGLLALNEKLGPILWQFPPNFLWDADRFESFFELLPRDTKQAAKLAAGCDKRMKGKSWFDIDKNRKLRYAVEIRHESFRRPEFIDLLRRHKIALVIADTAGKWPFMEDLTADFVYARLHGDEQIYVSGYTPAALDEWAKRIGAWKRGAEIAKAIHVSSKKPLSRKSRDVYVYFDNDVKVRSPIDAMSLAKRVAQLD
jgi:uncharacterized protein YecE (DUF72 family)